ncbi:MAG: GyrI-like domain-containing protein [Devosia sp.]|nr:GyrI-like domain-containing protein [Devosia sp.]
MTAEKLDLKKTLKALYTPSTEDFTLVDVPTMRFVKVDGQGDPNKAEGYQQGLNWIYSVSYALKFASKAELGKDYAVMPLETLWWADDMADFTARKKDDWRWTQMVMTPAFVSEKMYEAAVEKTRKKLGDPPASLRFEPYREGLAAQILHIGSYDDEAPTIKRLHEEFIPRNGLIENGLHHEIYLSDPRKTEAAKLRTILRHPVRHK